MDPQVSPRNLEIFEPGIEQTRFIGSEALLSSFPPRATSQLGLGAGCRTPTDGPDNEA